MKNTAQTKKFKSKPADMRPIAFLVIDQTKSAYDHDSQIIRINESLLHPDGSIVTTTYTFGTTDGETFDPEASKIHKLNSNTLSDKPVFTADSYDWAKASRIVVWESSALLITLKRYNILKKSKILCLSGVARLLKNDQKKIKLIDYVSENIKEKSMEFIMSPQDSKSKLSVLIPTYNFIKAEALKSFGFNDDSSLGFVGSARDYKTACENLELVKQRKIRNKKVSKKVVEEKVTGKTIIVASDSNTETSKEKSKRDIYLEKQRKKSLRKKK
ncbi:hypothetical protein OFK41_08460 [Acinetobacter baumannii]|uniref:hypothetical protein n=1 Tax=Acinetobacter baumannii TaxID=470 RepID=UPI00224D8479|nr:hypothetical protein [Acinetobacter baumannii]MCX3034239.1 hypothetical protein [Acinetobacter baumannii]